MFSKKYRLSYLPLFYDDLDEKVTYIAEKLKNPKAANDLLDKVESAIMERLSVAESFEPYHSVRERRYSYYRIDKQGRAYIYFTVDEVKNRFHCANDKAVKLIRELDSDKGIGLI